MTQNGVIETATGDLLRAAAKPYDFENDGAFDGGTETIRTDVPVPAYIQNFPDENLDYHNWDGGAWILVPGGESGMGSTSHADLEDLSPSNDHPQYVKTITARSALSGTEIDFDGDGIKTKTLTSNTTFTIANPQQGRTIILELDGDYTVTLPGTVTVINGDYLPTLGKNYCFIYCIDAATPAYVIAWAVVI